MVIGSYRQGCAAALVLLTFALPARSQQPSNATHPVGIELDRNATFERARIYYESGNYPACVQAFTRLLEAEPARNNADLRQRTGARTYLAACLIATGKIEQAREQFRQAILENRQMETPDPVVFPQAVIDVYIQVHGSLMDALRREQEEELRRSRELAEARAADEAREQRRIAELERIASTERLVHKNERWMAWVPFGVGQFNNGDEGLGLLFLTTEVALAATAITATSIELGLHSQAEGGAAGLDPEDLSSKVRAARTVGTIAWSAWALVAAGGILEANLNFRPEIPLGERRGRPLPDSLKRPAPAARVTPQLEPTAGGVWLGVSGLF
jgi:tetratricopeptide (TPR) repeat protein